MKTIIASLILLLSSTAQAMTVIEYKDNLKSSPEYVRDYISGLANGYEYGQAYLISKGMLGTKTYCISSIEALNSENMLRIIDKYIQELIIEKGKETVDYYPIELILMWSLDRYLPCK